jgi:heterodisulfide reductase subunit A
MEQSALVIGGGIAGIQAALDISEKGYPTYLIEKEDELGGRLRDLNILSPSSTKAQELLKEKLDLLKFSNVKVMTSTQIKNIDGFVGNFDVELEGREENNLKVGIIALAIGAEVLKPNGYFYYGQQKGVVTNHELEGMLLNNEIEAGKKESFCFVLCVGAREKEGNTGCSRYCCENAINQAVELAEMGKDVAVFYRDIRTFTKGAEEMYRNACNLGVKFIRYSQERPPAFDGDKKTLKAFDTTLQENFEIPFDNLVLVVPMTPAEDAESFQAMLKVPRGLDGFFLEQHPKLAPLQSNTRGIFLCGTAQGPKNVSDTISQASGVAAQAITLLSKPSFEVEGAVALVDENVCWGCGKCVEVCEFGAPELVKTEGENQVSSINAALCKGCGVCAVSCPSGALLAQHFTRDQVLSMIEKFGGE